MESNEQTIRDFLVDVYKIYETVKEIIYNVVQESLTTLANIYEKKLNQILDLPISEENWKVLREFLAVKSE